MIRIVTIFILTFNFNALFCQIHKNWTYITDNYCHNSSTYCSNDLPVELIKLSDSFFITLSQNGNLSKIDSFGNVIWTRSILGGSRQRIDKDQFDNLFVTNFNKLYKYDSDGEILWVRNFSDLLKNQYVIIDAVKCDLIRNLYIIGHINNSKKMLILCVDYNGEIIWKRISNQKIKDDWKFKEPQEIAITDKNIYILCNIYHSAGSLIYKFDKEGKNKTLQRYDYKFRKIKFKDSCIIAVGNRESILKDSILIATIDQQLNVVKSNSIPLLRNSDYEKSIKSLSEPMSREEFNERFETFYNIKDFDIDVNNNMVIVGNSNGNSFLLKVDKAGKQDVIFDNQFNFQGRQEISQICIYGEKTYITGISEILNKDNYTIVLYVKSINIKK